MKSFSVSSAGTITRVNGDFSDIEEEIEDMSSYCAATTTTKAEGKASRNL